MTTDTPSTITYSTKDSKDTFFKNPSFPLQSQITWSEIFCWIIQNLHYFFFGCFWFCKSKIQTSLSICVKFFFSKKKFKINPKQKNKIPSNIKLLVNQSIFLNFSSFFWENHNFVCSTIFNIGFETINIPLYEDNIIVLYIFWIQSIPEY